MQSARASDGWCEQASGTTPRERRDTLFVRRDELAACLNPKVGKLTVNQQLINDRSTQAPPPAAALPSYLTEASVYVLVTSVGADCYVCILSHGAIALRCGPPRPLREPTTHQPTPTTPPFLQSCPRLPPVRPQWPGPPSILCTPVGTLIDPFLSTYFQCKKYPEKLLKSMLCSFKKNPASSPSQDINMSVFPLHQESLRA